MIFSYVLNYEISGTLFPTAKVNVNALLLLIAAGYSIAVTPEGVDEESPDNVEHHAT